MIFITQLIYIRKGKEKVFDEFEQIAIRIIPIYNGNLLLRIRPDEGSIIECNMEKPYELHFISFSSEKDLENFMEDDERKQFLHLKEQSVKTTLLIKGMKI